MSVLPNTAESCRHMCIQMMLILEESLPMCPKRLPKYLLLYPVPYVLLFPKSVVLRAKV